MLSKNKEIVVKKYLKRQGKEVNTTPPPLPAIPSVQTSESVSLFSLPSLNWYIKYKKNMAKVGSEY